MKKVLISILISLALCQTFSQDSTPLELYVTASNKAQKDILKYDINQVDSIYSVINKWENVCGENEPIARLKILLSISQEDLNEDISKRYVTEYIFRYNSRLSLAKRNDLKEVYSYRYMYFSNVQIDGEYDKFTKSIAEKLIDKQKQGSSEYLLCLLFTEEIKAYEKSIRSNQYKGNSLREAVRKEYYETSQMGIITSFNVGTWIPIGELSNTYSPSPSVGMKFGFNCKKDIRIDVGINARFLNQNRALLINIDSSTHDVKSKSGAIAGIWINKQIDINEDFKFDAICGIGVSFLDTDLKVDNNDKEYLSITTPELSLGFNIRKRVFMKSSVGLNCSYNFSPYHLSKYLENEIGSNHITTALVYSF